MGLKKFLPGRRGRPPKSDAHNWFNAGPTIYETGYYHTLVQHAGQRLANFLSERLRKSWVKPEEATGVEFGPGLSPLAPALGFKQMVFVDSSRRMIGRLQEMAATRKAKNVVVWHNDIRGFDQRVPENSVAIVSEVLTHLRPSERLGVLERLATRFDRIYLVDPGGGVGGKRPWGVKG